MKVPMKKTSTQTITLHAEADNSITNAKPTKKTLDFIRQFARCYHYEKTTTATIGGVILN